MKLFTARTAMSSVVVPCWSKVVDGRYHEIALYPIVQSYLVDAILTLEAEREDTRGAVKVVPQFPVWDTKGGVLWSVYYS